MTHGGVSCGPRKRARANRVSILEGTTKSCIWCLIWMAPNLQWRCPPLRGGILKKIPSAIPKIQAIKKISSFFSYSFSFHSLCINHCNLPMHASIWLKFGTLIGGLKANTSIKFEVILINIQGVISVLHSSFYQAYRVNRFEEQAENWFIAKLNIRGVPFGG